MGITPTAALAYQQHLYYNLQYSFLRLAIYRWGSLSLSEKSLGGYDVLSIVPSRLLQHIRLNFTTYFVSEGYKKSGGFILPSTPSVSDNTGLERKVLEQFHMIYSRLLLGLTLRRLGMAVPWI